MINFLSTLITAINF